MPRSRWLTTRSHIYAARMFYRCTTQHDSRLGAYAALPRWQCAHTHTCGHFGTPPLLSARWHGTAGRRAAGGGTSGSVREQEIDRAVTRLVDAEIEPIALFLRGHRQDLGVGCDCSPSPAKDSPDSRTALTFLLSASSPIRPKVPTSRKRPLEAGASSALPSRLLLSA